MENENIHRLSLVPGDSHTGAEKLVQLSKLMDTPYLFEVHQLVKWKANMRNKTSLDYDVPAVVRKVFEKPLQDNWGQNPSSPYFREPIDMVIGYLDRDGDLNSI